ncbi:hypothetical protein Nepgr_006965 [Nepenthes gracilis]|uniref:NAC domain-containing protein n=1 Tax=Nepenthes gracilis TaxID=150966 RepID=A0AAD3S635_NEPGR|nr:hypothetical protein Nepgr_006965 [Nepenthes gracilis]
MLLANEITKTVTKQPIFDSALGTKRSVLIRWLTLLIAFMAGGNFLHRIVSYVVNELVVESLANSPAFQRFAVRTSRRLEDISNMATQKRQELAEQIKEVSKNFEEPFKHQRSQVRVSRETENMEEKIDVDKVVDIMLPGFRFHPTDEELVGFYLKRKIRQQSLPTELIKQLDIYQYDPWDLPKFAASGDKEWYFYCPRDRKYRNSVRPNRVTGAGFWKATGTDRPIYSSDGSKCIGLKKSLVFYRGRAAKGVKTDWMMHEFRLPSLSDSIPPKKLFDKSFPANVSWAICRIFKKTNSMGQRALSHSWVCPLPETAMFDICNQGTDSTQFSPDNIACTTDLQQNSITGFSSPEFPYYKVINLAVSKPSAFPLPSNQISTLDFPGIPRLTGDMASMTRNLSPSMNGDVPKASETANFGGTEQHFDAFPINLLQDMQGNMDHEDLLSLRKNQSTTQTSNQWARTRAIGFPLS